MANCSWGAGKWYRNKQNLEITLTKHIGIHTKTYKKISKSNTQQQENIWHCFAPSVLLHNSGFNWKLKIEKCAHLIFRLISISFRKIVPTKPSHPPATELDTVFILLWQDLEKSCPKKKRRHKKKGRCPPFGALDCRHLLYHDSPRHSWWSEGNRQNRHSRAS